MERKEQMPFGKKNYVLMLTGIGLLVLGFVTMSLDNQEFGFGFLGLTLGPIIVVAGFLVGIFSILHNPHKSE